MSLDSKKTEPATGHSREVTDFVEELLQNNEPIVIKINGKKEVSIQGDDCRRLLLELVDRAESIEHVQRALESVERGEGTPLSEAFQKIREKYDIPDQA